MDRQLVGCLCQHRLIDDGVPLKDRLGKVTRQAAKGAGTGTAIAGNRAASASRDAARAAVRDNPDVRIVAGPYIGCVLRSDYDAVFSLTTDEVALQKHLRQSTCQVLRPGSQIRIKRLGLASSSIQLRYEGDPQWLYAPREAAERP